MFTFHADLQAALLKLVAPEQLLQEYGGLSVGRLTDDTGGYTKHGTHVHT